MTDKSLPTTKLKRTTLVAKAALKIGATQTKGFVKRKLSSKEDDKIHQKNTDEQTAQIIIDSLGALKGISVKIAQQIALGMPFLPQEYLEKISKSFNQIPPINKALIRKVIKQELGSYPHEIFEEFESEAFGAASLGQVHKAKLGGEDVAIKVQYPGIVKSMESDMSMLKFAMKRFAKGENIDHLIDEVNERLKEEVDYIKEAENTKYFYKHLSNDKIIIPKIHNEESSQKVLTSSYLEGMSFDTFLDSNPSQETRDAYAQLIFDTFFISLYKLKQIHADPNPGNFIFMSKGRLGMIDFGCVKKIDEAFLKPFNALHLSLIHKEKDEDIVEQYVNLKMIKPASMQDMLAFYREVIKPLDSLYIEIFYEDSYDFKEHCDFSKRGFDTVMQVQKKQLHSVHQMNEEYIFIDRTLLGYYAMFEKIQAKIDTRMVKGLMEGYVS
jgi:predicted unusual protein kinase regulating ubiquinone biosynthesis (AarF/ABC1/UbiB family)